MARKPAFQGSVSSELSSLKSMSLSFDLIIWSNTILIYSSVCTYCKFMYRIKYPIYSLINHNKTSHFPSPTKFCIGKRKKTNIHISATSEMSLNLNGGIIHFVVQLYVHGVSYSNHKENTAISLQFKIIPICYSTLRKIQL